MADPCIQDHEYCITVLFNGPTDEIPSGKTNVAEDAGFGASALDEKIYNSLAELDKEEATVGTPGSIPNTPSSAGVSEAAREEIEGLRNLEPHVTFRSAPSRNYRVVAMHGASGVDL